MLKHLALTAAMLAATVVLPAAQAQEANTFRIVNNSSWRLDHVYVSPASYNRWGDDLLSGYMYPNQYLDLRVYDGYYDVKVVDKDGDSCMLAKQHLYGGTVWTLDNVKLLSCEILTASR